MMGVALLTKVDKTTTPKFQTTSLTINHIHHSSITEQQAESTQDVGQYCKTECTNKAETVVHYHLRK